MDIPIKYDHKFIEKEIYKKWENEDYFSSYPDNRIPYAIIMPPPNVTGVLHIGHVLNNTIQDVLIRYARMNGYNTCWIPGLDHASIATEAKVVEKLKEKGLSKFRLGRKKFINHVLQWTKTHKEIIINQIKQLGCSCDWKRLQFTMDEKLYESVIKSFIFLYKKGYIYRGYHVVNWDTKAKTTISDEEVIYKNVVGNLYYIKYKIEDENNFITVATTRPETIFGDTAICFHPNDERFYSLKGKNVIVPITNKIIPVIQDSYTDPNLGTGCFKITPAHDIYDKKIADKYQLEMINIFNEDGTINENGFHYKNMDRFESRKKIIKELKKLNLLKKIEKIDHRVGFSERTLSIIECIPSIQWFIKMKDLAIPAIEAIKKEKIKFYPKKIKNIYFQWMNKIHDWNISRQLWWGHRIPVYYYGKKINDFVVAENIKDALNKAKKKINNDQLTYNDLKQDPDVLDTWFSSWLLPLSIFDGIKSPNNPEISYYYPTENLITGSDILFFWVAKMIISGFFFREEKPFKNVFFTGIVRDYNNKKISKSLKNSPNCTKLISEYGADAVRFGVMIKTIAGKDINFDDKTCIQGRNLSNKIWNSFRLIKKWKTMVVNELTNEYIYDYINITIKWIENRFYYVLEYVENKIKEYKLDESLMILYKFFWNDFCSIFLEIMKTVTINKKYIPKNIYYSVIKNYENILKLLHPYIPFISEKVWGLLRNRKSKDSIMISSWPKMKKYDINIIYSFERIIQIITKIRNIRNENNISNSFNLILFSMKKERKEYSKILSKLVNISNIILISDQYKIDKLSFFSFFLIGTEKFFLSLDSKNKNFFIEKKNSSIISVEKKIKYLNKLLSIINKNLNNEKYRSFVPDKILSKERKKKIDTINKIRSFKEYLKYLKNQ
ncbi:valine--tRNA ligase [Blattabacterium cuenoti]|uniref:valine--tRNA ligase n=1 Tax=Blattabacterium cuenoti TaxID=1653831 RepID=UPI00163C1480|nr:valine--tRNA ligase [Blattabacterium cuenoti]